MARSDETVEAIKDSEGTILGAVEELDKHVEGLYDLIANIPTEDMSDEAKAKVEAAISAMKTNVLAAVTKAGTDDPKEEPPVPEDV